MRLIPMGEGHEQFSKPIATAPVYDEQLPQQYIYDRLPTYLTFKLLKSAKAVHMPATSSHRSKRFLLKSSSTIFGQVFSTSLISCSHDVSDTAGLGQESRPPMQNPSSSTMRSS